jgi:uncharacterized protein YceK
MRKSAVVLAAVFVLAVGGCGTMNNLTTSDKPAEGREAGTPPADRVYGGVALDARVGSSWLAAPFIPRREADAGPAIGPAEKVVDAVCKVGIGTYVLAVDMPLSAVADTLTLPVTVPAALKRHGAPAARRPEPADQEDEADQPEEPRQ